MSRKKRNRRQKPPAPEEAVVYTRIPKTDTECYHAITLIASAMTKEPEELVTVLKAIYDNYREKERLPPMNAFIELMVGLANVVDVEPVTTPRVAIPREEAGELKAKEIIDKLNEERNEAMKNLFESSEEKRRNIFEFNRAKNSRGGGRGGSTTANDKNITYSLHKGEVKEEYEGKRSVQMYSAFITIGRDIARETGWNMEFDKFQPILDENGNLEIVSDKRGWRFSRPSKNANYYGIKFRWYEESGLPFVNDRVVCAVLEVDKERKSVTFQLPEPEKVRSDRA